jgi:hypothetical protein
VPKGVDAQLVSVVYGILPKIFEDFVARNRVASSPFQPGHQPIGRSRARGISAPIKSRAGYWTRRLSPMTYRLTNQRERPYSYSGRVLKGAGSATLAELNAADVCAVSLVREPRR